MKLCLLPSEYNVWDIRANYYCYSGTESSASSNEIWKLTQRVKSDKTKHIHGWTGPKKEHPVASFPVQIFQPHLLHAIDLYDSEETDLGASPSTTREGTPLLTGQWHPKRKDEAALIIGDFLVSQMMKNLPVLQETLVWPLGQEYPLEKGLATHPCILAWRIPWIVQGSQNVRHDWATLSQFYSLSKANTGKHKLKLL